MKKLLKGLEACQEEYQSLPFWSWNDKLEEEHLVEQIEWMHKNGAGGFFMHARGGLKTPYLSEEWMNCIDVCVKAAKERGMQAWVYDEDGWPSGFVGGKLLEKEENRDCFLLHTIGSFDEDAWLTYSLEGESLRRITKPEDGEVLNIFLYVSPSTADILNPDVVGQFLAETHERYKAHYGEDFSKSIAGFFTDEPQYFRWHTAYTRMMPSAYMENYGEDLLDSLGLLFVEKEGFRRFRYRYWFTMQHLMLQNFSQKVYGWCKENGVRLTGHYVEEVSLGMQMICCGGIMPFYEYMHMPGIDWLNREVGNPLPAKQIVSAARQLGKRQIISETFACCGWDVTPTELRWIADFQYVGGVNRICHHLIPYSEHGQRKRDYPSHFSKINPWVSEYFKEFNDYYTRLGYLLANTQEPVKVAMLHPMRSAYLEFQYTDFWEGYHLKKLDETFRSQLGILTNMQVPFHLLDETLLEKHGFVNEAKIGCGLCEYEYLVIPTCYTMGKHTEKLIHTYVKNGGKVLLMADKPQYLEGEPYDYDYLCSTVSLEELSEHLPYRLREAAVGVHSSFHTWGDGAFLFVQNYGEEENEVSYELKNGYVSFEKWDMTTMTYEVVPPEITIPARQSCVLVFSKKPAECQKEKTVIRLGHTAEVVTATENFLTLDTVQFSKDGICYSEEYSCVGLFQKLLEERYDGPVFLKYIFQVRKRPSKIAMIVEKGNERMLRVNGAVVSMTEQWSRDHTFYRGDITPFLIEGNNEIVMEMNFYQSESVYYALFGENVTESLKNCLVYDTEIEAIYLAGKFGVYAKELIPGETPGVLLGSGFYVDEPKRKIENLVADGYPFFSGKIMLKRCVYLIEKEVILEFVGRFQAMTIWVNGQKCGSLLYNNKMDISAFTVPGKNEIVIELIVSNRNLFGPHHNKDEEEPREVGPFSFELPGTWKDGKSETYRETYSLVQVPIF